MHNRCSLAGFLLASVFFAAPVATSGPLQEARVTKIINDVSVVHPSSGARPAAMQDVIKNDLGLRTGIKSRSELLFQDNTLTRIGPETYFTFKTGTREMALQQGTMLLQVPKGVGGAKIRTAAITASITGTTILLEHRPRKHLKVLVLEGSLRLTVNGKFGDALLLTAGKMVIMPPDARRVPDPVSVDLGKVIKTSSLVNMPDAAGQIKPLPSMPLIADAISQQVQNKTSAGLVETNLVIDGAGTNVTLADERAVPQPGDATATLYVDERQRRGNQSENGNDQGRGNGGPTPTPAPLPEPTPEPDSSPSPTATPTTTPTTTPTASHSPTPVPVPWVEPNTTVLPGTFVRDKDDEDFTRVGAISAGTVDLRAENIRITGEITANAFRFEAEDTAAFSGGAIRSGSIDGKAGELISLGSPVGATSITLNAPVIEAFSLNATARLKINGLLLIDPHTPSLFRANEFEIANGVNGDGTSGYMILEGAVAPSAGAAMTFEGGNIVVYGSGINGINARGGDAHLLSLMPGGDGGRIDLGSQYSPVAGDITVKRPINASTGENAGGVAFGGAGGSVNMTANGSIEIDSTVKVSDSAAGQASASGGNINVTSKSTSGTAILVKSSAQLLSLLGNSAPGPGGTIKFASAGGAINVSGTTRADHGRIEMINEGASGAINLTSATLAAGTVKAQVLGENGTLNIGGGSISADSLIYLYAGGSNGTVKFTDNVALNGNSVKTIAGNTVTIVGGKVVTINGPAPANVYTNNPNYSGFGGNGTTTGTFGGMGATTQALNALPPGD